jgi:mono/diheme cytochrome c family protein
LPDERCDQSAPDGTVAWREPAVPASPRATRASIIRGRDRFMRMCAPCHGVLGDGNSVIARDMMLRAPPSLLDPGVAAFPDQRIYEVISRGYGLMPSYAYQLSPLDRWAVVQFVRVLEKSQRFPIAELPAARQQEARSWLQ